MINPIKFYYRVGGYKMMNKGHLLIAPEINSLHRSLVCDVDPYICQLLV